MPTDISRAVLFSWVALGAAFGPEHLTVAWLKVKAGGCSGPF